ncbi:MAG: S41 family peptidase [Isosphaeraceae bacterium]
MAAIVRQHFLDPAAREAWARRHDGYGASVRSRDEFVEATRRALAELQTSHTAYYTEDDPQYYGLLSIFREALGVESVEYDSIGVDVDPGNFVRVVFAGSPAGDSGILRGDRILSADGRPFRPLASLRGRAGERVILQIRRDRDEPPREVPVVPRRIDVADEWREHQEKGSRIVEANGKKVAYMPLFSAAGEGPEGVLRDAIGGQFAGADALVLDFRFGWGGASPSFLNLFNRTPPVLESIRPDGTILRVDSQWRKPLYVLINGGSTSGKEAVAHAIQRHKIGTLVGERTAGAVAAGRAFRLSDGSLLYLAVSGVRVDGERLEGVGVPPDAEVADSLPFAAGRDRQLERALELAGT